MTLQSFLDTRWRLLSDRLDVILLCCGAIFSYGRGNLLSGFLGAIGTGLILYLLYELVPGAMGFGDVKLMPSLAIWLPWEGSILALWLAFCLGSLWGLSLMLGQGKAANYRIAFGPFLCLGALIVLLHGELILTFYYQLF